MEGIWRSNLEHIIVSHRDASLILGSWFFMSRMQKLHLSPVNSLLAKAVVCCLYESIPDRVCLPRRQDVAMLSRSWLCTGVRSVCLWLWRPFYLSSSSPWWASWRLTRYCCRWHVCTFFWQYLKTADYELKKLELCWICVQPCFRSAFSIWRTQTCCSLVGFWWPSLWRNGTFTSASLSEFCCSWVSVRLCKAELF